MDFNTIISILIWPMIILVLILVIYGIYVHQKRTPTNNSPTNQNWKNIFNYSPALLNAYYQNQTSDENIKGDKNGFKATFLDLINKEYIILLNSDRNTFIKKSGFNGPLIKINRKKKITKLKSYEIDVIKFLKRFSKKEVISLYGLKEDLKNRKASQIFQRSYGFWENHLQNEYLKDNKSIPQDLVKFRKEAEDFKSYISSSKIASNDISPELINQYLVYAVALGIENKAIKSFEKYLSQDILHNSEICQICKSQGLDFVDEGVKGAYLVKSGEYDEYTNFYGY